jgi:hypothetical protein
MAQVARSGLFPPVEPPMTANTMIVKYEYFHGEFKTWDGVFAKAAQFAAHIGRERLISISHNHNVVAVWYWGEADSGEG